MIQVIYKKYFLNIRIIETYTEKAPKQKQQWHKQLLKTRIRILTDQYIKK